MNPNAGQNMQRPLSPLDNDIPNIHSLDLAYPPSEREHTPVSPTHFPSDGDRTPRTRPGLRVITQPGRYIFSLRSAPTAIVSSAVAEYPPESAFTSSPVSSSSGPLASTLNSPLLLHPPYSAHAAPAVPTSHHQTSGTVLVPPPPVLPKLLPDPFFHFPSSTDASTPQAVSIPPATEREVETHCKGPAPSVASTRPRKRTRPTPKTLSQTSSSSSEDLSSQDLSSPESPTSLIGPTRPITHPYARIFAKRDLPQAKRRKIWNHALEKSLFTPDELANMRTPHRRKIYVPSLEAHIDAVHSQLNAHGAFPHPPEALEPYHGLSSKTLKSIVAGLFKDASEDKMKLLELRRANDLLRERLSCAAATTPDRSPPSLVRRHSIDGSKYTYPNIFDGQSCTIIS